VKVFSHFSIVSHNFEGFREDNNNNNNNLLLLLSLSGFKKEFEREFNPLSGKNLKALDLNMIVLVNVLVEVNLKINHIEKKSNHVKLIKFEKTEVKNLNK